MQKAGFSHNEAHMVYSCVIFSGCRERCYGMYSQPLYSSVVLLYSVTTEYLPGEEFSFVWDVVNRLILEVLFKHKKGGI